MSADSDALRRAIAAENSLYVQAQKLREDAARWARRAELAAAKGETDLARQALARQADTAARAARYETEYHVQAVAIANLKRTLRTRGR